MTKTIILAGDRDFKIVNGVSTGFTTTVSTAFRTNIGIFQDTAANSDQWLYERYFAKSGTYRVRVLYMGDTDKGIVEIGINKRGLGRNTTNIVSQLDTYAAGSTNNLVFDSTVQVARGVNEINIKINGKNASSSSFRFLYNFIEFVLIAEHPVLNEDGTPSQQGSTVLLARHRAELAESTVTFNLADIPAYKYSEIQIKISGEATASLELRAVINQLGTNYLQKGESSIGGTITGINITTGATLRLASTSILTGAVKFNGGFTIQKDKDGIWNGGNTHFRGYAVGKEDTDWNHDSATSSKLTTVTISTSTSTWKAGTTIEIYGVRR